MQVRSLFLRVLALTFLIKLGLAAVLPLSGDEAYFIVWARHLDFGYYDHPPMVAWILAPLLPLVHAAWWVRLPALLFSSAVGVLVYRLLRPWGVERAAWTATLFLLWPFDWMNVLITTDTPLILFVFLSGWSMVHAVRSDSRRAYALAGFWLGCAFLSKYFAVVYGLGLFGWFAFTADGRRRWRGALWLALCALPEVVVNVYWNMTHCWDNILFNLYNRNAGSTFSLHNTGLYLVTVLYLATPPVLWAWWRDRRDVVPGAVTENRLYAFLFWVPTAFFLLLSLGKTIGLHWVLAFYPFLFLMIGLRTSGPRLRGLVRFMLGLAVVHALVLSVIVTAPAAWWQSTRFYSGYVLLVHPQSVLAAVRPFADGFRLATNDYSTSALMSWHAGQEYFVFGPGSKHARQDDMTTDFRALAGRNILVFDKSPTPLTQYAPYFRHVEQRRIIVDGAVFYLARGYGFDYPAYRQGVLARVRAQYYRVPDWLPMLRCGFCERYFAAPVCAR